MSLVVHPGPRQIAMPRTKMRSLMLLLFAILGSIPAMGDEVVPPWWQVLTRGPGVLADVPQQPATTPAAPGGLSAEGEWIGAFFLPADDPMTIYLDGEIEQGTALDFRRALERRPDTDLVYLASNGGFAKDALLIAHEIAVADIATAVPTGRSCYSACAYVFFAGSMRIAFGEVGVHQFSGAGLDAANTQLALSIVLDALSEFKVSQPIISAMLRTSPDDIHILSQEELRSIDAEPGSFLDGFAGILDGAGEKTQAR